VYEIKGGEVMANEQNLKPNTERTPKERQELARKAGKASGEARREKATLKSLLPLMMSLEVKDDKDKEALKALGLSDDELCNGALVSMALLQKAMKGNIQAIRLLAELNGENQVQGTTNIGAEGVNMHISFEGKGESNE
jgi:hypothetical protein